MTRPTRTPAPLRSLSAFFPVRDEEDTVVPVAEAILESISALADWTEVLIVDDGSRDRTAERAEALARTHDSVRVVHHAAGLGYGAAVRTGLRAARGEWVFFTDGDGQFDPSQIADLAVRAGEADVVVGFRRRRSDRLVRRLNGAAWNVLVRLLLDVSIRDVNCAFKLFRRSAVTGIELTSDGAALSAELVMRLVQGGYRIVEIPVHHHPRRAGTASGGHPRVIGRAFVELLSIVLRRRREARDRRMRSIVGATASTTR
jgi:glycosyltransferase involved in cell wall biosynthesis